MSGYPEQHGFAGPAGFDQSAGFAGHGGGGHSDLYLLAPAWRAAALDGGAAADLEAIYALARDAIEARGPACWASGRCCNFRAAGHRLYVTGLEAAYTLVRLEREGRVVTREEVHAAIERGDCPLLTANLCGAHAMKPLGCRVYFCDRAATTWQSDLSERLLAMIRALHQRRGIEYRYAEWGAMLEALTA